MKKRFVAGTMVIVVLALLVSTVTGAFVLSVRQMEASGGRLRELLAFMDAQEETTRVDKLAETFSAAMPDSRLTVIAPDGAVLKDTGSDTAENHLERPEIQDAMETGWGEIARRSATLGYPMLYVAKRFSDGVIVRAATPMSTVDSLIWSGIPPLIAAALAALALAWTLSRRSVRQLVKPLISINLALQEAVQGRDCDALKPYEEDDELRPILRSTNYLAARVRDSIASAVAERDKIALVLDCMDEGLILLDDEDRVLVINRAARELFGLPATGEGMAGVLLRGNRVVKALAQCHREHTAAVVDLDDPSPGNRELRMLLSPVSGREYEGRSVGTAILISDVTELKKAENIRSEFTANVSHELKTPLTSIRGSVDLLSQGLVKPEDQGQFYTLIQVEVDRLISLINDILELSELESAAIDQPDETASPLETAREVETMLAGEAGEKRVAIYVAGDPGQARISPGHLKELLTNLMENAVRYGREGGSVEVRVARQGQDLAVAVRDDGIGIPAEALPHLFERFYRVDKSRSKATGGTGLGLAIVKHICERYGGSVRAESVPGRGSTFTVLLPAA